MIAELRIGSIEIPQGFLPRVITGTMPEKVKEYAEMIENGVSFDPIKVWKRPDGRIWLIDGAHRLEAHKMVGKDIVKVEFIACNSEIEYRIEAVKANLRHGIPLLKEEKIILAQTLYRAGVEVLELTKIFGVSERTVRRWIDISEVKRELQEKAKELRQQGLTQEQIAKELGIPRKTISDWLNSLAKTDKMSEIAKTSEEKESTQTEEEDYSWVWEAVDEMEKEGKEEKEEKEKDEIEIFPIKIKSEPQEKEVKFEDPDEIWERHKEEIEKHVSILLDKFGPEDTIELLETMARDIALKKYKNWEGYRIMLGLKKIRGREW